jgi:hypothetical protein
MSESSPLDLAVKLLIDSGAQVQSWITRFIAVNGALLFALGALLGWSDPVDYGLDLFKYALMAICLFGFLCSLMLGGLILSQLRWNKDLRARVRALQDEGKPILPEERTFSGGVFVVTLTGTMVALLSVVWIALLLFIPYLGPVLENS